MNALSGIPGRTPSFLIFLLGNGHGASQQFVVQHSTVMSGCHIRSGISGWLAAKRSYDPEVQPRAPKAPCCHKQGSVVCHPTCQR